MPQSRRWFVAAAFLLALPARLHAQAPDTAAVVRDAAQSGASVWRAAGDPPGPNLTSRDLFTYALALCEAKQDTERLQRLFELGRTMQDRDPKSRGYGNFRWRWSQATVEDANAVEFCMQGGTLLWIRHRDTMPAEARAVLRDVLEYAVQGCLRHRVSESYTNIALMNAENLILLGEMLDKPAVADEGYARLDRVCACLWESGVHEYCSPTYYGVDLDCLGLIEGFCGRERGRAQARALLELFWTDIGANWFWPSPRLGGARSRDYDYVRGLGMLDTWMALAGWLPPPARWSLGAIFPALSRWRPSPALRAGSEERKPRLVRQCWGLAPSEMRTAYLLPDIALSSSGATYGNMDIPLAVDLPGERALPRCYFIADGRHDPYGKVTIAAGAHQKTLHLAPFFSAAQRGEDAVALVVYRDRDVPKETQTLESHFVMRRDVEGFWVGDRPVSFRASAPESVPVKPGEAVVLRQGTAALGIRVPWTRALDGVEAPIVLTYDGNRYGVVRLTVEHHHSAGAAAERANAAALFWVRVGSGLKSEEAFQRWRQEFAAAPVDLATSRTRVRLRVPGTAGPVAVSAEAPYATAAEIEPAPSRVLLELNGEDLGRRLLQGVEPIRSYAAAQATPPIPVAAGKGTAWEARAGAVLPPMVVGKDPAAAAGAFVWMPGEPGAQGGSAIGSVTWRLKVAKAGVYYLWGHVLAPTPDDDSFYVRLFQGARELLPSSTWALGTHPGWEWVSFSPAAAKGPEPLALPAGEISLQLRVREDGAKIDRLFLTASGKELPR